MSLRDKLNPRTVELVKNSGNLCYTLSGGGFFTWDRDLEEFVNTKSVLGSYGQPGSLGKDFEDIEVKYGLGVALQYVCESILHNLAASLSLGIR